jgi:hypothetical protein
MAEVTCFDSMPLEQRLIEAEAFWQMMLDQGNDMGGNLAATHNRSRRTIWMNTVIADILILISRILTQPLERDHTSFH